MSIILREYPSDIDPEFLEIFNSWWEEYGGDTLIATNPWYERYYILWQYAKELSSLEGDFVECGAYNGSSSQFMAEECKTTLHLIDSWEGLSENGEYDNPIYDATNNSWVYKFKTDLESTKDNLKKYTNIEYHKGWIPEVLTLDTKISLLNLDLDLYQPTKDCLEYFWDKVVDGGVVISDFHDGVATGAEKATRDFFKNIRDIEVLPTGKAIIIK